MVLTMRTGQHDALMRAKGRPGPILTQMSDAIVLINVLQDTPSGQPSPGSGATRLSPWASSAFPATQWTATR